MRIRVTILAVATLAVSFLAAGQTSRPAGTPGGEAKAEWFKERGIEPYPNLVNAREMPVPPGKDRPGHMLNAQTRDPLAQVVAFYNSKYPDARSQQMGTSSVIEGKTANGSKFLIRIMPAGSTLAIQYTTEK